MLAFILECLFLQAYGECRDNEGCEAFRVCRHGVFTARHEQGTKCLRMASRYTTYYIRIIAKNVEFYNFEYYISDL